MKISLSKESSRKKYSCYSSENWQCFSIDNTYRPWKIKENVTAMIKEEKTATSKKNYKKITKK